MRMKKNKHSRVTSFIHQKKWQGPSVSYAQFEQGTNPIFECKDLWERRGEKKVVRHSLKNERERERERVEPFVAKEITQPLVLTTRPHRRSLQLLF